MKILFLTRHFGCLRNFERPVFALAEHGHTLHLVAHQGDILGGQGMVERWCAANPALTWERLPEQQPGETVDFGMRLRLMVDYLRYLDPAYTTASGLVRRARIRTPQLMLKGAEWRIVRSRVGRGMLRGVLTAVERALPRPSHVDAFFETRPADVVLFTPLLALGSEEMDYLDAAVDKGLPTSFCVWSWDNLSSKALLRTVPTTVMVWNATQKREAMQLHGVPKDRVVVTGAQSFDHWFEWAPQRSRDAFCARVGLPANRPYLLWVCSAVLKGSPPEAPFVKQWIERLRSSTDPALRDAAVLIRPHPSRHPEWEHVNLADLGPVALWGANPIDQESRADYYESLLYASGVVGLNTSAFLEAAIVGRPVYTIELPEHFDNQRGTLHYEYLLREGGGLLHAAGSWDEHLRHLADAVTRPWTEPCARSVAFVDRFIRPLGRSVVATERFVDSVEQLPCRAARPARRRSIMTAAARRALPRILERAQRPDGRHWLMTPRELEKEARIREKRAAKDKLREAELAGTAVESSYGSR